MPREHCLLPTAYYKMASRKLDPTFRQSNTWSPSRASCGGREVERPIGKSKPRRVCDDHVIEALAPYLRMLLPEDSNGRRTAKTRATRSMDDGQPMAERDDFQVQRGVRLGDKSEASGAAERRRAT
jgi:hypothetical protein